jgi:hypothetical protein
METNSSYLESAKKQFLYYKTIGEKAMNQLQPEQLFVTPNINTNSIAIIVQHLSGNMLSRWIDFRTTDGEKEWRNRDLEFENDLQSKEALLSLWDKGWKCLLEGLDSIKPEELNAVLYIRNEEHTYIEAINRQLAHYPYHVGQIIFYAKLIKENDWDSLSIPKNNSDNYNAKKIAEGTKNKNA